MPLSQMAGHYANSKAKAALISLKNFMQTTIHPLQQHGLL
jgi:hypothetical protein